MELQPVLVQLEQQLAINQTLPLEQLNMKQAFYRQASGVLVRTTDYNVYDELITSNDDFALPKVLETGLRRDEIVDLNHYQISKNLGQESSTDLQISNSDSAFKILTNAQPIAGSVTTIPAIERQLNLVTEIIWDNLLGNNLLNYGFLLAFTIVGNEDRVMYYLDKNNQWKAMDLNDPYDTENAREVRNNGKLHLLYYSVARPLGNKTPLELETLSPNNTGLSVLTGRVNIPMINGNVFDTTGAPVELENRQTVLHMVPFVLKTVPEVPLIMNQNKIYLNALDETKILFSMPALNYAVITDPRQSHLYMAQRLSPDNGDLFAYGHVLLFEIDGQQVGLFMMGTC